MCLKYFGDIYHYLHIYFTTPRIRVPKIFFNVYAILLTPVSIIFSLFGAYFIFSNYLAYIYQSLKIPKHDQNARQGIRKYTDKNYVPSLHSHATRTDSVIFCVLCNA